MSENQGVPFNDLARIHKPLLQQFKAKLEELLDSSSLVLGKEVSAFEAELAQAEGCRFSIGVNSGTAAIELALRAFDVGPGDEVITTAFTFVATCFAILQTGATPVLIDIDAETGLMDPARIQAAITKSTKALVFVTLHGRVENLELIQNICTENKLVFIIDAAQSHLGTHNGMPQSHFCDATTLSFYPGKNLGALGEGGAILTNSEEVAVKVSLMRDWGALEKYNHVTWGGNFRLETLQASFLRIKLRELVGWTKSRREIADTYNANISPSLLMQKVAPSDSHVYHIFSVKVEDRLTFQKNLEERNIGFGFHYPRTIHQQSAYGGLVKVPFLLPHSEWLAERTISIPLFPGQSSREIEEVLEVLSRAVKG